MATNLDMKKFKAACEDARDRWNSYSDAEKKLAGGVLHFYRCEMTDHDLEANVGAEIEGPRGPRSFDDIKAELGTAAMAAGIYGATREQIVHLARLAVAAGERGEVAGGRLTRDAADNLIRSYQGR